MRNNKQFYFEDNDLYYERYLLQRAQLCLDLETRGLLSKHLALLGSLISLMNIIRGGGGGNANYNTL